MDWGFLRIVRDWSIVLLALEAFLLSLVPFFILRALTRWLRRILPNFRDQLVALREKAEQLFSVIEGIMAKIYMPLVGMHGRMKSIQVFLRNVTGNR